MQEEPARRPKSTSIRLHTTSATPNRSSTSNTNRSSTSNTNSPANESSENGGEKSPPLALVVRTSPPGLQRNAPGAWEGQGGREQEGLKDFDRDVDRDLGSGERRISYASLC